MLLLDECVRYLTIGGVWLERPNYTTANLRLSSTVQWLLDLGKLSEVLGAVMGHAR